MPIHYISNDKLHVGFDRQRGTITSLRIVGDAFDTEYAGNLSNTSYPSILKKNQWLGDWRFRVWDGDTYREELTSISNDIRSVALAEGGIRVSYQGVSSAKNGLRSLNVDQIYRLDANGLLWTICVENQTDESLEVGEISLAMMTNTDVSGVFSDPAYKDQPNWAGEKQRIVHEQRVTQHLCVNGGSAYALLQRANGIWPALLFQPEDGTSIENAYQMDPLLASQWSVVFEGPYYLSLYSRGAKISEGWKQIGDSNRYSLFGDHSLILSAHERRMFSFRFSPVSNVDNVAERLYEQGALAVHAVPGMVAPSNQPIRFRLRSKHRPVITAMSSCMIRELGARNDCYDYELSAKSTGQKELRIQHGGRETRLLFFLLDDIGSLLRDHAKFVAANQYYENPSDPYGRHHAFLPYDGLLHTVFADSVESFQVCASDELCLTVGMFLAESNALQPVEDQITILEEFVDDFLYSRLQDRETYLIKRGLYYTDAPYPSEHVPWPTWDKKFAYGTDRSFNYALVADIYYSMYRIAARGHTTRHNADWYLELLWRTSMLWFTIGDNKWNGAPDGMTITAILAALKETHPDWYRQLDALVADAANYNATAVYPYGSELLTDQTANSQLYAMFTRYGYASKRREVIAVCEALRDGGQPAWFLNGNEKRGNVCCWYGTAQNSWILYDAYDRTRDLYDLRYAYAGLTSFLTTIRGDGSANGWFLWWPDRFGFDSRSLDTDMGMYAYLRTARSYIVEDEAFGLCGYGCDPIAREDVLDISILDGVGRTIDIIPLGLRIRSVNGGMRRISLNAVTRECRIVGADATDVVVEHIGENGIGEPVDAGGWTVLTEAA